MSAIRHDFDLASGYSRVKEIKNSARKIEEICGKYGDDDGLGSLSSDDLCAIVFHSEKSAISCRKASENLSSPVEKMSDSPSENYPDSENILREIKISFDGRTFRVFTPLTLKRGYNSRNFSANYTLMSYVTAKISAWRNEKMVDLYRAIEPPLVLVIKRKVSSFNHAVYDNDNQENGRIANAIMNALGVSDNALNLSVYSCAECGVPSDQVGMEFIVFAKAAISDHVDEL